MTPIDKLYQKLQWVDPNEACWVHHLENDQDWETFRTVHEQDEGSPLDRVLRVARELGCQTVLEENRYVDPDFRSEYSVFWSKRFADTPAFSRRLHFLKEKVDLDQVLDENKPITYLGYSCLRPVNPGKVGRTMIAPPPSLEGAVMTLSHEKLSLFGRSVEVQAAPFVEQDQEYLRCAHAAAWICHYSAFTKRLVGRKLTQELVDLTPLSPSPRRALPSPGLTFNQLQAIFAATGQPALFLGLSEMPEVEGTENPEPQTDEDGEELDPGFWDTRIVSVLCRYLNAGFPVLVGSEDHAFVVVGWRRDEDVIKFILCDDQRGPYIEINSPFDDKDTPWQALMVPLPPKVFVSGENAESTAHYLIRAQGYVDDEDDRDEDPPVEWSEVADRLESGDLSLRTFLRSNHEYKSAVSSQERGSKFERAVRLARLPHYVWVVEVIDPALRERGEPSVLAECVIDSTSVDDNPTVLVLSLLDSSAIYPPDSQSQPVPVEDHQAPWRSLLPA